jgi:cysteine-rich repeat protein
VAATSGTAGAQSKCSSGKVKASGKKAAARTGCYAKAVTKGLAVDAGCLQKATDKFTKAFTKAESKGDCLSTGDLAAIEAKVDAFAADVAADLGGPGPSKCTSSKVRAAGKKADAKSKCHAKAIGKGLLTDGACLTKAEAKFTSAFSKAEAKGDCLTTGDTASVEATVDAFITDLVTELKPPVCGNGDLESGEGCDDGNLTDGDGCDSNCTPTGCGNGIVTAPEACDDGNAATGDGCRPDCTQELCGDGIQDPQEQCDDGNTTSGDGCNSLCESEAVTCAPTTAGRTVRVDINTPQPLAGVRVDLEYPQAHTSVPGLGNSSLVQSRVTFFPTGTYQKAVNDQETDMLFVLFDVAAFINSGPLVEVDFDQCTALSENMCNRNQNVIGCCNNMSDPNQFGNFCQIRECANLPGTPCSNPPQATDCGGDMSQCTLRPCTADSSCTGGFGLCVFKCPANPPVCPIGTFPPPNMVGPCTSTPGGCPSENACISQTASTLCTVSDPVDDQGQPVSGVSCSVTITEVP